jgi:hypothetical protein
MVLFYVTASLSKNLSKKKEEADVVMGEGGAGDEVMGEEEEEEDDEEEEEEEEELGSEEGLGDDGKVRFYMVCCTSTSLYVLSVPKLDIVFKYSPTEQTEAGMNHSSSSALVPITSGPPLLLSSIVNPENVVKSDKEVNLLIFFVVNFVSWCILILTIFISCCTSTLLR